MPKRNNRYRRGGKVGRGTTSRTTHAQQNKSSAPKSEQTERSYAEEIPSVANQFMGTKNNKKQIKLVNRLGDLCKKHNLSKEDFANILGLQAVDFFLKLSTEQQWVMDALSSDQANFSLNEHVKDILLIEESIQEINNYFLNTIINFGHKAAITYLKGYSQETQKQALLFTQTETGNNFFHSMSAMAATQNNRNLTNPKYKFCCESLLPVALYMEELGIDVDLLLEVPSSEGVRVQDIYVAMFGHSMDEPFMLNYYTRLRVKYFKPGDNEWDTDFRVEIEPWTDYLEKEGFADIAKKNHQGESEPHRTLMNGEIFKIKKEAESYGGFHYNTPSLWLDDQNNTPLSYFLNPNESEHCTLETIREYLAIMGAWTLIERNHEDETILFQVMKSGNRELFTFFSDVFYENFPEQNIDDYLLKSFGDDEIISPFHVCLNPYRQSSVSFYTATFKELILAFPKYIQKLYPSILHEALTTRVNEVLPCLFDVIDYIDLCTLIENKGVFEKVLDSNDVTGVNGFLKLLHKKNGTILSHIGEDQSGFYYEINIDTMTDKINIQKQVSLTDEQVTLIEDYLEKYLNIFNSSDNSNLADNIEKLSSCIMQLIHSPQDLVTQIETDKKLNSLNYSVPTIHQSYFSNKRGSVKKGPKQGMTDSTSESAVDEELSEEQILTLSCETLFPGDIFYPAKYIKQVSHAPNTFFLIPNLDYIENMPDLASTLLSADDIAAELLNKHYSMNSSSLKKLGQSKQIMTQSAEHEQYLQVKFELKLNNEKRLLVTAFKTEQGTTLLLPVSGKDLHQNRDKKMPLIPGKVNLVTLDYDHFLTPEPREEASPISYT